MPPAIAVAEQLSRMSPFLGVLGFRQFQVMSIYDYARPLKWVGDFIEFDAYSGIFVHPFCFWPGVEKPYRLPDSCARKTGTI